MVPEYGVSVCFQGSAKNTSLLTITCVFALF
jgi:hypothetical protein